jgi:hypothetical protein
MKGVKRFGVKGKLAPHYIWPFPMLEKCGIMAYKLDLPPSLARVHNIFHVLQCLNNNSLCEGSENMIRGGWVKTA